MAVQLTEFCPPRRRNERTNELPRGIRNYFSQSNEQDAKLVLLFQGVYFFSFSFFFYRISKRIFFPLEKAWKRVSKREGERERPRVSRNFRYFERNCRESIWKIISRDERVSIGENLLEKKASKLISRKIQLIRREKKGKRSFSKEIFVSLFLLFTANQGELRSSFEEKEKKKDLLSPFSPLRLSPAR